MNKSKRSTIVIIALLALVAAAFAPGQAMREHSVLIVADSAADTTIKFSNTLAVASVTAIGGDGYVTWYPGGLSRIPESNTATVPVALDSVIINRSATSSVVYEVWQFHK